MKKIIYSFFYCILVPLSLWYGFFLFDMLVTFSYTDHILSWIPYLIIGGWIPAKFYGLTIFHLIFCIVISHAIIRFFDKRFNIGNNTRLITLIIITFLFAYESFSNYFYPNSLISTVSEIRQMAIIQFSFVIGILITTFNPAMD